MSRETRGPLAVLADRCWLQATDDADPEPQSPELIYKLGFLNALQVVGYAAGNGEVDAAIAEAVELESRHELG